MSLDLLSFVLSHYGFLALLTLFACLVGTRLTRNVVYDSVSEKFSVCTGLGLGIIASVVLLLGVLHLLMPEMILVLFGISCVFLWPAAKGLQGCGRGMAELLVVPAATLRDSFCSTNPCASAAALSSDPFGCNLLSSGCGQDICDNECRSADSVPSLSGLPSIERNAAYAGVAAL